MASSISTPITAPHPAAQDQDDVLCFSPFRLKLSATGTQETGPLGRYLTPPSRPQDYLCRYDSNRALNLVTRQVLNGDSSTAFAYRSNHQPHTHRAGSSPKCFKMKRFFRDNASI